MADFYKAHPHLVGKTKHTKKQAKEFQDDLFGKDKADSGDVPTTDLAWHVRAWGRWVLDRAQRPTRRYTLLEAPDPRQTLVHVHPDPGQLGRVYEPDLAIAATLPEAAAALLALEPVEPRWRDWTAAARADYERNLEHEPMEGDVDLGEIMAFLRRRLPGDAIQTCGAGNFTGAGRIASPGSRSSERRRARDPARWATGSRRQSRRSSIHPAARRRVLHRRRRLRDELARARDRGAVRPARSSSCS